MTTPPTTTPDPVLLAEIRLAVLGITPARRAIPVPPKVLEAAADTQQIVLTDTEGAPVATFDIESAGESQASDTFASPYGTLSPASDDATPGPFAELRLAPADVSFDGAVAIVSHDPIDQFTLDAALAQQEKDVVFIVLDGPRATPGPAAANVIRAALHLREHLRESGRRASVVVVPAPQYGNDLDDDLADQIAAAYGTERVIAGGHTDRSRVIEALDDDRASSLDEWPGPSQVAWRAWRPPRSTRGLVLFFTGLSGSGKSTVARAVVDRLLEDGQRSVTLLDGDVVRRNLSAGLGFSREDRDRNIERIGFVAAEIAKHGGTAVCAPIAPFAATRERVRAMAEAHADFVLVHVATPLEECERRDRKGLYAKARRGEISDFTGISSPYERPEDADVVVDTSDVTIAEARDIVIDNLVAGGWLPREVRQER